jgi:hypothetical protein
VTGLLAWFCSRRCFERKEQIALSTRDNTLEYSTYRPEWKVELPTEKVNEIDGNIPELAANASAAVELQGKSTVAELVVNEVAEMSESTVHELPKIPLP